MNKLYKSIAALLLLVASVSAEQVSIFGKVTDVQGLALDGVVVRLAKYSDVTDTTDEDGLFYLNGQISSVIEQDACASVLPIRCTGNAVYISITCPTHVTVDIFNTEGRRLANPFDGIMQPGSYSLPITVNYAAQMVLVRIRYGSNINLFRLQTVNPHAATEGTSVSQLSGLSKRRTSLVKTSGEIDTLTFTRSGYETYNYEISSYTSEDSLKITMQPIEVASDELIEKFVAATASIMQEVQNFRGKDYLRDINVSVQTRSQYAAMVGDQYETTSQEMKDLYNSVLKLEGLLRPQHDFFESRNEAVSGGTGGYYVPGTDSLYIIVEDDASGLSQDDSVCLFHELVHALQDQYFGLSDIMDSYSSSDSYYATMYTIEGEAELLCNYYLFKLENGTYPSSSRRMVNYLEEYQILCDEYLDRVHEDGDPLLAIMPMYWEYYSYGPLFINEVVGMEWSLIDSRIFTSLPLRMLEVFHPENYSVSNEYTLNVRSLENAIDAGSNEFIDEDELGELLVRVMFREWDFTSYNDISDGLLADNIIVYRNTSSDSLSMVWNTRWQDSSTAAGFFDNYASLVNKKRDISLPDPVDSGSYLIINDTLNRIYIEQSKKYVFSIENYQKSKLDTYVSRCRAVQPYGTTALAKAAEQSTEKPRVDKRRRRTSVKPVLP